MLFVASFSLLFVYLLRFVSFAITLWEIITRHKPCLEITEGGIPPHSYAIMLRMDQGEVTAVQGQTDRQTVKQTDRQYKVTGLLQQNSYWVLESQEAFCPLLV